MIFQGPIKFHKIKLMSLIVNCLNNTDLLVTGICLTSGEESKKDGLGFSSWSDVASWYNKGKNTWRMSLLGKQCVYLACGSSGSRFP